LATTPYTTPTVATSGTYYIKCENASGCFDIEAVTVIVTNPVLTINNPAAVCFPNTVDITDAAVTAGSNFAGGTLSYWTDAAATIAYATPTAATNGTYYIKVTTGGSCQDIKPVNVTVHTLPTAAISGTTSVCSGAGSNIIITGTAGATVTYTINSGANQTVVLTGGAATLPTGNLTSAVTYDLVSIADANCGQNITGSATVSVNPLPTATISGTTSTCSGGNADITFTGTAGATVTYTVNSGSNQTATIGVGGTVVVNSGAVTATTTYDLVSITDGTCGQNLTGSAVISINALPSATISGTTSICSGSSTDITFTGTTGATVIFSINSGGNQSIILTGGSAIFNATALTANTTYTLVSISDGTCSQNLSGSAVVTILPSPTASISGTTAVCSGTGTTIGFTGTPNATVHYTINAGVNQTIVLNGAGTASVSTGNLTAQATYALVDVTDGTCLNTGVSGSAIVDINDLPTSVTATASSTAVCSNTVQLT
jgi:hypothetical protein